MVTEIRNFHSLRELSENIEEEISFCKSNSEEYGERLGAILRDNKERHGDEEWFKALTGLQGSGKDAKSNGKSKGKGKGKKGKKRKSGWIPFKDIMLSKESLGEAQILFDAVEDIKTKIAQLEKIRDNIDDLKRLGLGEDIIYITYMREGIPEKIVLYKKNGEDKHSKFEFNGNITLVCPA
ncbi:MAG: hypothetical protein IAX21_02815 [Candidatus Bathyarchaeota archaeon]|nr:MAG: hypothetical protein IAX21_02815 [Candidatus Bathyarchaeota archaeon]